MFCKRCRYPLTGLATPTCPECGSDFDPADPRSYIADLRAWARRSPVARIQLVAAIWPVAWLVFPYGTWLIAILTTRQWPNHTRDLGKSVPGIHWAFFGGYTSCCAFPLIAIAAVVFLVPLYVLAVRADQRAWWARRLALTLACWIGAYFWIIAFDPGSVIHWFMAPMTG